MLTQQRALELFIYDEDTGDLRWRHSKGRAKAGSLIRRMSEDGYWRVCVDGVDYRAHRVIFLMKEGRWPIPDTDHEDMNKTNNRWSNLREATRSNNQANKGIQSNNTSGHKGVSWHKNNKKWRAYIKVNGKQIDLGHFKSKELAIKTRQEAFEKAFPDFYRHQKP